jgi:hypothetical protein
MRKQTSQTSIGLIPAVWNNKTLYGTDKARIFSIFAGSFGQIGPLLGFKGYAKPLKTASCRSYVDSME